jgi:hypothetical protein
MTNWDVRNSSTDLFYLDETGRVVHSEHITADELCLRKLVDATMLRNQLWEHTRHERNGERQAAIHLQDWHVNNAGSNFASIEQMLFESFAISKAYTIQYYVWTSSKYEQKQIDDVSDPLRAAIILLDHALAEADDYFEIEYSVLDLHRKTVFIFLRKE